MAATNSTTLHWLFFSSSVIYWANRKSFATPTQHISTLSSTISSCSTRFSCSLSRIPLSVAGHVSIQHPHLLILSQFPCTNLLQMMWKLLVLFQVTFELAESIDKWHKISFTQHSTTFPKSYTHNTLILLCDVMWWCGCVCVDFVAYTTVNVIGSPRSVHHFAKHAYQHFNRRSCCGFVWPRLLYRSICAPKYRAHRHLHYLHTAYTRYIAWHVSFHHLWFRLRWHFAFCLQPLNLWMGKQVTWTHLVNSSRLVMSCCIKSGVFVVVVVVTNGQVNGTKQCWIKHFIQTHADSQRKNHCEWNDMMALVNGWYQIPF